MGDTRYVTTIENEAGERQIGSKAPADVIETVLNQGEDYKDRNIDIMGTGYIGHYMPLYQQDTSEIIGMIFPIFSTSSFLVAYPFLLLASSFSYFA